MIIRPPRTNTHEHGNLGFAKATNLGIAMVETPYFTMCNDDVEFINRAWWWGVLDTFKMVSEQTPDRPAMMVNPASTKLPDWSVGRPAGEHHYIIPYKKRYSQEDWDFLMTEDHYVNEYLTIKPGTVIDGVTLYCTVTKTKEFHDVGMLDEAYYPGGAEDYDYCCRASLKGYRCVGTTLSWVFHHWSKSFATIADKKLAKELIDEDLRFGDHNIKWGYDKDGKPRFDLWGVSCLQCGKKLITVDNITATCVDHEDEIFDIPQSKIVSL